MGAGRSLPAWGRKGRFRYEGSLARGTKVVHGRGATFTVTAAHYADLLARFGGREVAIGASFRPPRDSLGAWLRARVGPAALAAYVGPILVAEGAAERVGPDTLRLRAPA